MELYNLENAQKEVVRTLNLSEKNRFKNAIEVSNLKCFDIEKIFDCGQSFRFEKIDTRSRIDFPIHKTVFCGVAFDSYIEVAQDNSDKIIIYGSDLSDYENIWRKYLSIDLDYEKINQELLDNCKDEIFHKMVEVGVGIRILRQEPWETICSFIISQNNNIPRIKKIIQTLSESYGTKIITPYGETVYTFPSAAALYSAGEEKIREAKTGFRAKYIIDAAQKYISGELDVNGLFVFDQEKCCEHLCTVKGIGKKVANCVMLFAFEKYDAFPVDVWIKRVLEKYFPLDFDVKIFGTYAGIAQQYFFYYERFANSQN